MEPLHEMDNSRSPFSVFCPSIQFWRHWFMFPIIFRQEIWEGSMGLQSYPVPHEVGSHVYKGIFGNRIVEALNSDLPIVLFYCQGSQGKPGSPSPGLQFKQNWASYVLVFPKSSDFHSYSSDLLEVCFREVGNEGNQMRWGEKLSEGVVSAGDGTQPDLMRCSVTRRVLC